ALSVLSVRALRLLVGRWPTVLRVWPGGTRAVRFAYADPPYLGQARKHYRGVEVDHEELIDNLCANYAGWALSCSSPSLRLLLMRCPSDVRVGAWVKPFCSYKP